ncbi:contact-dependent growth inhibition system immunity protein [Pseudomonas sp. WAC2]|uniref:contact-dependent growth inhibition system immunity protein n=1 Tax=Pseudomonas sp. WAC2 TaxID=3055057 RepID=UPI0025B18DA3|nr:contact-dependent growth inhibition system immunity protein [Pseudomonas sp. WAC2]MDN3238031.1 contact-dependent growth inhibition system immunity protein [Pseudomonas sp. WAC2]
MEKFIPKVSIIKTERMICLCIMAVGRISYFDYEREPIFLEAEIEPEVLGESVLDAIQLSRSVSADEFQKEWDSGSIKSNSEAVLKLMMSKYNYKNKKAFYGEAKNCLISIIDNEFKISPFRSDKKGGFSADKENGPFSFTIPLDSNNREVGDSVLKGFSLCT